MIRLWWFRIKLWWQKRSPAYQRERAKAAAEHFQGSEALQAAVHAFVDRFIEQSLHIVKASENEGIIRGIEI